MDSPEQLALHGTFLRERNRYDEAIAAFKQALAGEPNSDEFHYELALTYLEHDDEKQLSNALDSINKAIGLDPEEDHYYAVKGLIYINQGKSNEARKAGIHTLRLINGQKPRLIYARLLRLIPIQITRRTF